VFDLSTGCALHRSLRAKCFCVKSREVGRVGTNAQEMFDNSEEL